MAQSLTAVGRRLQQGRYSRRIESSILARGYCEGWQYDEAEELENDVLQKMKGALGVDHLDTLVATANMANTYGGLERYDEAGGLQKEVLQKTRVALGVDHPDAIGASANLAVTYSNLGRYGEAEELERHGVRFFV